MKLRWSYAESDDGYYWLYWWNPLPKKLRYFGYCQDWYDGPLSSFGLWFFNISWRLPITRHDGTKSFGIFPKSYKEYD